MRKGERSPFSRFPGDCDGITRYLSFNSNTSTVFQLIDCSIFSVRFYTTFFFFLYFGVFGLALFVLAVLEF
jgi:hypothetical protein